MEVWKDIEGYEGMYQVSNTGKVKSLNYKLKKIEKELKLHGDRKGYLTTSLCKNGKMKTIKVHRAVAIAFIPNPDNKPEVNHKDGDKTNNCVSNLEWATSHENNTHAFKTGLKSGDVEHGKWLAKNYGANVLRESVMKRRKPVIATRIETGEELYFESAMDAEKHLEVAHSYISLVCRGKKYSSKGYTFRYADKGGDAHDNT